MSARDAPSHPVPLLFDSKLRTMKRSAYLVGTAVALSMASTAQAIVRVQCPTAHARVIAPHGGIAAVVNGRAIPVSEVSAVAIKIAGPDILDQLVGNTLVVQEATKRRQQATPFEIDRAVDKIRTQIKPKTLEQAIRERHLTWA